MIYWLLLQATAFAADSGHGGAHADPHAIPWHTLFVQVFNFTLLIAILVYALRKTVKAHFETRAREYRELVERAENARKEAEKGKNEIATRLTTLKSTAEQSLTDAKAEAQKMKQRLAAEAKSLAEKMSQEAERTAAVELDKAKAELRRELLVQALQTSTDNFKKGLSSNEQKKLQNEFAEKIQVVGG